MTLFRFRRRILFVSTRLQEDVDGCIYAKKCAYASFEPPVVDSLHEHIALEVLRDFLGNVMTWDDDLAEKKGFIKFSPSVSSFSLSLQKAFFTEKIYGKHIGE